MQQIPLLPVRRTDLTTTDMTQTVTEPQAGADSRVDPKCAESNHHSLAQRSRRGCSRRPTLTSVWRKASGKTAVHFVCFSLVFECPLFSFPLSVFHQPPSLSLDGEKKRRKNKRDGNAASTLLSKRDSLSLSPFLSSPLSSP